MCTHVTTPIPLHHILYTTAHTQAQFICPIAIAQNGTDYKITCICLSVCLSVCDLCYSQNSQSTLLKLCTVVQSQKNKIEIVMGQNLTTPSPIFSQFFIPIMHFLWQGLNTTVTWRVDRLQHLIAQRTLLGSHYTDSIAKCYNSLFLAQNSKWNFNLF